MLRTEVARMKEYMRGPMAWTSRPARARTKENSPIWNKPQADGQRNHVGIAEAPGQTGEDEPFAECHQQHHEHDLVPVMPA